MSAIEENRIVDDRISRPEPLRQRRTLERSFGLIAGVLFIGGAFAGIPSSLLIDPAPPASLYLLTVAGVAVGLAAMVIPWDRISPRWAHVAMVFSIIQVGLTVALAGDPFVFYFVFIAIFAAYAFGERNVVAIYVGLIAIALLLPILVIPDSTRATAAQALAAIPAIVLVGVMVAFLRERLEDNRRTTRRFAREALALSVRIGRLPAPEPAPPAAVSTIRPRNSHPVLRRTAIGSSAILAVIAALGMMAAVGVALPGPIERSFAHVGIEHSENTSPTVQAGTGGHDGPAVSDPAHANPGAAPTQHANAARPAPAGGQHQKVGGSGHAKPESAPSSLGGGAASPSAPSAGTPPSASSSTAPSQSSSGGSSQPSAAAPSATGTPSVPAPVEPPAPVVPPVTHDLPHLGQQIQSTIGSLLGQHPNK